VPSSSPARGLHELAETIGVDLIIVGSAGHGHLSGSLAGTTAVALLHGSPCAVAIAPRGYRKRAGDGINAVVTGVDGSAESGEALLTASRLAASSGAKLKLLSVAVPPPVPGLLERVEDDARTQLAEACSAVPNGVEVEATLVSGDPVRALAGVANVPGTLLVVGSHGYGPLRRVVLGSVASSLVGSARCPLIITPRGLDEPDDADASVAFETAS
jgi:nucleotide-binding universal stress UspA family protein